MPAFDYPRLLGRLVNRPLLVTPARARQILGVLAPRAGLTGRLASTEDGDDGPVLLTDLAAGTFGGRSERKVYQLVDGVAVIPVQGTLVSKLGTLDPYSGMTGYDGLRVKLAEAVADEDAVGILLDIESPGGEAHSSLLELAADIAAARAVKPVWASCSDYAYSAAYWLAAQADRLLVPETGGVGSVGVVWMHADWSQALESEGVTVTLVHAGAHKVDGNPYQPLAAEVQARILAECEDLRLIFAQAVALGRRIDVSAMLATEAECFSAAEAVSRGLADAVAGPDQALSAFINHLSGAAVAVPTPAASAAPPTRKEATMTTTKPGPAASRGASGAATVRAATRARADSAPPDDGPADDAAPCDGCPNQDNPRDQNPCAVCSHNPDQGEAVEANSAGVVIKVIANDPKARISAILGAVEAKGRDALARHLALETDMTVDQARAALAATPKGSSLSDAMARTGNAAVGTGAASIRTSPGIDHKAIYARMNGLPKQG